MTTKRPCPVCKGNDGDMMHHQQFVLPEEHPLVTGYDIVCCHQCGFVFADIASTQSDYDEFYAKFSKYEDSNTGTGSGEAQWDADRLMQTAQEIAKHFTSHATLLDFGCANGGLLRALAQQGFDNLYGVDPSPICAKTAKRVSDAEIYIGTFSKPPLELQSYDGIILSHVLEHVLDVSGALLLIHERLNPGGLCYIEVPDATRYSAFYVSPFHFFDTEHINHFDINSLQNALRSVGLQPMASGSKLTDVTEGVPYPAIWVMAQKHNNHSQPYLEKSDLLHDAIKDYIELSQDAYPLELLTELAASKEKLIVWGVGCSTLRLLAETPLGNANIVAFADNNAMHHGEVILGHPVLSPDDLSIFPDATIVITSKLYGKQILSQIKRDFPSTRKIIMCYKSE